MEKKYVWEFTNQRKLTKKEFIDYFERKIFKTIRRYGMLDKDKVIRIKKSENINARVLKKVLEKKFIVKESNTANFSFENCSDISEKILRNVLNGKFVGLSPKDKISRPLYFHLDKEIELYAKLNGIKGEKTKRDKKVEGLLKKFIDKNQDIEINIIKAMEQIQKYEKNKE